MLHFCPHCIRLHFIVENIQFRSKARACQPLQRYRTRNAHRQHDRWEKIATTLNDQILQFSTPKSAPCLQFPCTEGNVRVDCFSLISLSPLLLLFTLSFVLVISTVPCLGWHGGSLGLRLSLFNGETCCLVTSLRRSKLIVHLRFLRPACLFVFGCSMFCVPRETPGLAGWLLSCCADSTTASCRQLWWDFGVFRTFVALPGSATAGGMENNFLDGFAAE